MSRDSTSGSDIVAPNGGERVRYDPETDSFVGSDAPVVPVVRGQQVAGTADDESVLAATLRVLDAGADEMGRTIHWLELPAGGEPTTGGRSPDGNRLPEKTVAALETYRLGLLGPCVEEKPDGLRTALREQLSLDVEMRQLSHLGWTPSPVSTREHLDVVCFRDVTEDAAAGLEFEDGTSGATRIRDLLESDIGGADIAAGPAGFGIRPVTRERTESLVERAAAYAFDRDRSRLTVLHQGDQLPATEGGFRRWALAYLDEEYADSIVTEAQFRADYDSYPEDEIVVASRQTDDACRELLASPREYDVIVAPALAGEYVSSVAGAALGGHGVTASAFLGEGRLLAGPVQTTEPGQVDPATENPIATIRAGCLLFEALGWADAADVVREGIEATLAEGILTRDLARQAGRSDLVTPAAFAERVIEHVHTPPEAESGGVRTTGDERAAIKRTIAGVYNVLFEDRLDAADITLNQLRGDDEEADIHLPEVGINFRYWRRWSAERRLEVLVHEFAHVENYDDGHEPAFYDRFVDLVEIAEDWQAELEALFGEPLDFERVKRLVVESVHEETIEPHIESVERRKRALRRAFGLSKRDHY